MPIRPIPAPGYQMISGKRAPPKSMGTHLWCQIRNGFCDEVAPWPVDEVRWRHDGSTGDVVAVKQVDDGKGS